MFDGCALTFSPRRPGSRDRILLALCTVVLCAGLATACADTRLPLTQLLEARRLASEVHVQFTRASEAANRAVMADTDVAAAGAADEARRARDVVARNVDALRPLLLSAGYSEDARLLDGFKARFDEYGRLDDDILPLAVEKTNLRAQRLSWGTAREAADAFRASLDAAVHTQGVKDPCRAAGAAGRAERGVLEIQVMQAPHIAEAEDAAMTRMEGQMATSASAVRSALAELRGVLTQAAAPQLDAAGAAFDRFMAIHAEIITLSRRNSDVRSLALSLGRKRVLTAECEDRLRALEEALAKHQFTATR